MKYSQMLAMANGKIASGDSETGQAMLKILDLLKTQSDLLKRMTLLSDGDGPSINIKARQLSIAATTHASELGLDLES